MFDKFEVFVDDLVVLVGLRELLLNECEKGFPSFDVFTEGELNLMVVTILFF